MRTCTSLIATLFFIVVMDSHADQVLSTPEFFVYISPGCNDELTFCEEAEFVLVRKNDCKVFFPKGRAVIHYCADGVTPCSHLGFEFKYGGLTYRENDPQFWAYDNKKEVSIKAEWKEGPEKSNSYVKVENECRPSKN